MKRAFLAFSRAGMETYFAALTDKPYAVVKSRGWGVHNIRPKVLPSPTIISRSSAAMPSATSSRITAGTCKCSAIRSRQFKARAVRDAGTSSPE